MKKYPLIAVVTGALFAAGCDQAGTTGPGAPAFKAAGSEDAVALVNGKPISKSSLEVLQADLNQRRGGNNIPEEKIVDDLIKGELLRQEAESQGLDKDPKVIARLENAQRVVFSQAAAEHFVSTLQISDEDLQKEYQQRIGPMKGSEFKARHILVDNEKAAKDIIAKLGKGEKFEVLAKKLSKDPGSKDKGGDLGWFNPQQMVAAFSEAVAALKNGEITKAPVQSQFGWHVIQREDSREQQPPAFDAVKEQLRSLVQSQKVQQFVADLQNKAKIENRVASKPEPADPATPAAPAGGGAGEPPAASPPTP